MLKIREIVVLAILFIISSCNSLKYYPYSKAVKNKFFNDSLKVRIDMAGDVAEEENIYMTLGMIKDISRSFPKKNIVFSGRTTVEPFYNVSLFATNKEILIKKGIDLSVTQLFKRVDSTDYLLFVWSNKKMKSDDIQIDAESMIKTLRNINEDSPVFIDFFNENKHENNILYFNNELQKSGIKTDPENNFSDFQLLATYYSVFHGSNEYKQLLNLFQHKRKVLPEIVENDIAKGYENIENILSELIKDQRIVMINENHWLSENRILVTKILKKFKENGFGILAVEAFDPDKIELLNQRGFPLKSDGFYLRDPFFGIFIREAIALKFKLVSYDTSIENREDIQAQNIYNVLQNTPSSKVLAYVGFSHLWEKNNSKKWMAEILKEKYHIDPLTIDQQRFISNSFVESLLIPSYCIDSLNRVDFYLVNNLETKLSEVYDNVIQYSYENNVLKAFIGSEVFASLYYADEYNIYKTNCIPLWNKTFQILTGSIEFPILKGKYIIRIEDFQKNKIAEESILVK